MDNITVPENYAPSDSEEFMNPVMKEYFRQKLVEWRENLVAEYNGAVQQFKEGNTPEADLSDQADYEMDLQFQMRTKERERKLIRKIDEALRRIELGTYGYCEETGEPISVARLDARPVATLSFEAQERLEREEKMYRE